MMIRWAHICVPLICAGVASAIGTMSFWDESTPAIMMALSVIAAGVLVRLARGLPFTNAEHFEVDEARKIAAAIKQSARSLRVLIIAIFLAMGAVIFSASMVQWANNTFHFMEPYSEPAMSATIGLLLSYVLLRILAVIKSDVSLVDTQSQILVNAVERKQAERFSSSIQETGRPRIKNPEGYGKIIQ